MTRQMSDDMLLEMAAGEKRILITNDKDFGRTCVSFLDAIGRGYSAALQGQRVSDKIKVLRKLSQDHSKQNFRQSSIL